MEAARAFVEQIRTKHADATHNCWAFVTGAPGHSGQVGFSDDGEPHGTAGRPMLQVLLHCGVGEITMVVTRWFGGVKLGTGGLVRAYQDSVRSGRPGTHLPARGPARPLRGSHRRTYRRPRPLYAGRGSVRQGAAARHVLPSPSKRLRHIHKKASRPSRPAHPAGAGPSAFSGTPISRGRWPAVPDRDTNPPNIKISPACCPADGARPFFQLGGRRSVLPRQRPYCITFTGTSGARRTIPSMMTCSPALSSPSTTLMSPDSKRMFTLR